MNGVTADTNIYISALLFAGQPLRLLEAARRGLIRLDISDPILDEIARVLRDKFAWPEDRLQRQLRQIQRFTNRVMPTQTLNVVQTDPDDNRVLECAVAAGSRYIVSGDGDLLGLGSYAGMPILRVTAFLALLQQP